MTTLRKTTAFISATAAALFTTPLSAFAQDNIDITLPGTSQFSGVSQYRASGLARALINLILVMAGLIAFFFLLWGGLQWILAGGDKDGTEKARKRITAALIGLVIVFSAYAIIVLFQNFLGINILTMNILNVSTAQNP